jgi:ABC-type glycerol-3-phosphate transport system substrate-binding protein
MKKVVSFVVVSMLLFVFLFSIGSSAGKVQIIKYWYPWGGDSEKWDKWRISEFEKDNPGYKVEATYVPTDGGIANGKLMAAIAGGNAPDLVITHDYASAYSYAAQGALLPLDSALKTAGFRIGNLNPVFLDVMRYKGKIYLFPQDSNVSLLYYNIDLFKEAGLDPAKPPKTISQLDAYVEKLTKITDGKIERLGFIPWIDAAEENQFLWAYMFGANVFDANSNKVDLTSGKLTEVLKWEGKYAQKYNPEKIKSFTSGFGGAFSPDHPFMTGKVAMTVNGNWFNNALKIYAPKINYAIAPIPAPESGRYGGSILGTNVFLVPKGAKNIKGAAAFMMYAEKAKIMDDNIRQWRSVTIFPSDYPNYTLVKQKDKLYETILSVIMNKNSGHTALTSVAKQMSDDLKSIRDNVIYNGVDPTPLLSTEEKKLQNQVILNAKQSERK